MVNVSLLDCINCVCFLVSIQSQNRAPIGLNDLALTWRMHKRNTGCKAKRIQSMITLNNETVGFRCECGYEFIQKRLISQKAPDYPMKKLAH